jgi:hypothetical protein
MGGLGNQLFQIFATIAYVFKHNRTPRFPDSAILGNRPTYWSNFLSSLMQYTIGLNQSGLNQSFNIRFNESGFHYQEIPIFEKTEPIYIVGYYQSYKYFEEYYEKICDLINLNEKKEKVYHKFPKEYSNMISMHFRIGDYKHLPYYHPVMPYEYYKNALQCILDNEKSINEVLYFCELENNEEVALHIDRLKVEFPFLQFIKGEDIAADYEQMLMMSLCKHNIIANSSFSWFSAYLNNNKYKIVCYPSVWFGQGMKDYIMDDLCPKSWNKINF